MDILERIAEPTTDGLRIEDGSSGSGLVYRTRYGIQWIWAEAIPGDRPGEEIPFALVYRGDVPRDVAEDLDLDHATIEEICSTAGMDPAGYRQLAEDPDPAIRFEAIRIYAAHYGWVELDHTPKRYHPSVADDLLDGLRIPTNVLVVDLGVYSPRIAQFLDPIRPTQVHQITGKGSTPTEALEDALDALPPGIGRGAFLEVAGKLPEDEEELADGFVHVVAIRWID